MPNDFEFLQSKQTWDKRSKKAIVLGSLFTAMFICVLVFVIYPGTSYSDRMNTVVDGVGLLESLFYILSAFFIFVSARLIFGYAAQAGYFIFTDFARSAYLKDPRVLDNNPKKIIDDLISLNGKKYGQLNDFEKLVVHKGIAEQWCNVGWFLDNKTLKQAYKSNSDDEFYKVINNSPVIINIKESSVRCQVSFKRLQEVDHA